MGACSSCIPHSSTSVEAVRPLEPVDSTEASSHQKRTEASKSSSGHEAAMVSFRKPPNRVGTAASKFGTSPHDKQHQHSSQSKPGQRAQRSMSEGWVDGELPFGSRLPRRLKRYANHIQEHSQRIRRKYRRKLKAQRIRKQKPTLGPLYAPVESLNILREASKEHDSSSSLGSAVRSIGRKSSSMHSTRTSKTNGRHAASKDPPASLVVSEDGSFGETSDRLDGLDAEGRSSGALWRRRDRQSPSSARKELSRGLAEVSEDGDEIVDDEDESEDDQSSSSDESEPEPVAMSALEARSSGSLSPAHETSRVARSSRRGRALSMESGLEYLTVFGRQHHLRQRGRDGVAAESDIARHSSAHLVSAAAHKVRATVSTLDAAPLALPSGAASTQAGSTHSLQVAGSPTTGSVAPSRTGSQSRGRGGRQVPAASAARRVEAARSQAEASSQRTSLSGSEGDSGSQTASGSLVVPQLALLSPRAADQAGAAGGASTVPQ